jgi:hypothetical protein
MDAIRLMELGMKVYATGGDILLRMWYYELNGDDRKTFEDRIDQIIAGLGVYYDDKFPDVKVMTPEMIEFAQSVAKMFPMECSLDYHRYLANQLYMRTCPDCGLHIIGPARRKDRGILR